MCWKYCDREEIKKNWNPHESVRKRLTRKGTFLTTSMFVMTMIPKSEIQAIFFAGTGEKCGEIMAKHFAGFSSFNFQEKWLQENSRRILQIQNFPRGTNQNSFTARFWEWGLPKVCGSQGPFFLFFQSSKWAVKEPPWTTIWPLRTSGQSTSSRWHVCRANLGRMVRRTVESL